MKDILLLHGAIGAKQQLEPIAKLLEEKFKIHTMNFSGHGGENMPEFFSIENFAKDVLDYLDANKLEKINIFGYSMGGYVALYLAKWHPEKISKIFTLATKFDWTPEMAQQETKMLNAGKIEEKIPAFANELKLRHKPNDWVNVLQKTAEMMVSLGNSNLLQDQDFNKIVIPVSLNIGDSDAMVSIEETRKACEALPNATLNVLPLTQHPIEKANMQNLADSIQSFFEE